ncbi:hypothetical protein ACFX2A_017011 [Malus domestica]
MATLFLIFLLSLAINSPPSSSTSDTLSRASSLSVEKPEDVLISPDGVFTAGFHQVGNNSYCFAIWFSEPSSSSDRHQNPTVVWTANRDRPVNGKRSKLSLLKTGNLILTDAGQSIVWATTTTSLSPAHLTLHSSGNLVLRNSDDHVVLWQSFDSPTDTLLPLQPFTRNAMLVSTRSQSNSSSGFYKLFFNNDNLLRLLFDGLEVSSVYWPDPSRVSWDNARSTYNNTRTAMLDSLGSFVSSDNLTFMSTDYGARLQRMLRIDFDGNVRLYSRERAGEKWVVSWQAISDPCKVHGTCGANSVCSYDLGFGRKCLCLPGYNMRNLTDWSFGCEPQFDLSYTKGNASSFLKLSQVEFNGYDFNSYTNYSYMECESICLKLENCKGFQYTFDRGNGFYNCNPKTQLRSGHMSDSQGYLYLRLPKAFLLSNGSGIKAAKDYGLICTDRVIDLNRNYVKNHVSKPVKFLLWFACGVGGFEIVCILLFLCLLNSRTRKKFNEDMQQGYLLAATGFKRFSYTELKKATRGFIEEIGRGAGGFVYKGVLDDKRVAAVKLLNEAIQGEAEFLAEVSMLGRLNHMHLIEMWGYCSEGKHKLLVYEYMEHGSLAQNLSSNVLDWEKRFEIAVGTAKGLAYLHEECLEWVLHCDVKPQNILLDSNYQPKVADFGLSKLFNRGELKNSSFSRIRGTRGYIAPEWVYNLPITSKVDVYSYGIVVLEMVTGKNPMMGGDAFDGEQRRLISWMREKVNGTSSIKLQIEEIIDSSFEGEYDVEKVEVLLKVALHCVEEDKDDRPTMRQVVEMLLHLDKDSISPPPSSSASDTLRRGSSLSAEKPNDVLISPDGVFTAGFHQVGNNSFCFAIWFTEPSSNHYQNRAVVWMANRDQPVNGKYSKLSLQSSGNLILTDAGQSIVWATTTTSLSAAHLSLQNSGNLVLLNLDLVVLWQSFDFPTDTLLPHQPLTRNTMIVSMRSQSNFSSGFYKLFFDNDNLLRLLFDGVEISSVYWFEPWLTGQAAGRSTDNSSRTAVLDSLGNFTSSDSFTLMAADYGAGLQRRLTVDSDGNVRLYSREKPGDKWSVSAQVFSDPCKIHGVCGVNSVCSYHPFHGRKCSCIPGYKMKNHTDWYYGCEPQFNYTCNKGESTFFKLSKLEFFGYDYGYFENYTYTDCENLCLKLCNCKGFQYSRIPDRPIFSCYPKTVLLNGYRSPSFFGDLYLRVPKTHVSYYQKPQEEYRLSCLSRVVVGLNRNYVKSSVASSVKFLLWFAIGVGGFEIICILLVWGLLSNTTRRNSNEDMQGYVLAGTGFKRFSYAELKKATRGFSEEIGRGAGGIVYKGVLADQRVAAIKLLSEADQGEAEFLGEANTIGRLNHMHLIDMWGYCSEKKHKLLVYEYMEHGSLADKLSSNVLDWEKRFEIAVGTAKGLAYLHEECLEWVLHCDVKPQNILLDSDYQPKVADFGLSKLINRGGLENSSISRIRGTRGYIAPEWVYNQPITSKVDVYSYGIVVLEMVTGKNPTIGVGGVEGEQRGLINWVREKVDGSGGIGSRMGEIIDCSVGENYDVRKMEILLEVALRCVEEDKNARPTMTQVVEKLLRIHKDRDH